MECKNLEGIMKEITYLTMAIKRKPDLPKVDFIQPVWHFPSSLNLCLNEFLNIRLGHKKT